MIPPAGAFLRLTAVAGLLAAALSCAQAQVVNCALAGGVIGSCSPAANLAGGVQVQVSATGTTGAVAATLPAAAGKFTYICGFSVSPGSATAAITIQVTMTGVTNTFTWAVGAPATAVGVTGTVFTQSFFPCLPGSAVNTGIVITSGALGTAGINNDVNVWGFQL
jgi:hypothetical protein